MDQETLRATLQAYRTPDVLKHMRALIGEASARCHKQVEVRVNLPWALFDLGLLHLYLEEVPASLGYYAKGVELATAPWMVQSARSAITALHRAGVPLQGLALVDQLLEVGHAVRRRAAGDAPTLPMAVELPADLYRDRPVLVLAGGCDGVEEVYRPQLDLILQALSGFGGTLVSGGTRSGIAALPGDLQAAAGTSQLRTVGYVPALETPGLHAQLDTRCSHLRHTDGLGFTIREALTFWQDYLAAGGDPTALKLIGYNGGMVAGSEYRIALAFGAQVGIIEGSGRQADALLADPLLCPNRHKEQEPHEKDASMPERLALDVAAIRRFVER